MELEQALFHYFQFNTFRKGQREVIDSILSGQDTIAMLPTGTGKSLCYQLPGYLLKGKVIIISPLLSLMQDQVEQMKALGEKRAVAINSFLLPFEKKQILQQLDRYKFIFVSPEMLGTELIVSKLKELDIALLVIDEAHCISQWGYDFRPDYLKIGQVRKALNRPLTIALTATATEEVRHDIAKYLQLEKWKEFVFSVDRPEISIGMEIVGHQEKQKRIVELVESLEGPGIIYFSSKKIAEQMASKLRDRGQQVMAYHGGLDQEARVLIQQQFIHGQLNIVCATSAFGMGINKENVRYIIHYHMPLQLESYLQEIGRAGRDGKNSLAILLYTPGDEQLSIQLAEGEIPDREQINMLFHVIEQQQLSLTKITENEELFIRSCGFSETQWRIVANYIASRESMKPSEVKEKFYHYITERLRIKKEKIAMVLEYLQYRGCKRTFILNYFKEKAASVKVNCCSSCGLDLNDFQKNTNLTHANTQNYNWEQELASMLLK
ncbi:RecQ family ATP-dependent DNA helicase [Mesobacillus maritimus]|uniref:ATP-dependent DNA helicase RecQ n=1 Tax=Mesobacillus maritimus TaxID=1643336 RepID=A0ABS7K317_9BACI|nr:ATP-dependent DNA helicase RecQ [Mesobacillus maritimus]